MLIEKAVVSKVSTAPNEVSAAPLIAEFAPSVIITDRTDTETADRLSFYFQHKDYAVKVVVVGWNDDKIAVYSRDMVQPATIENLAKAISRHGYAKLRNKKENSNFTTVV